MSYNGFKNYETWAAKLWIDNDYGEYEYCQQLVRRHSDPSDLADILEALFKDEMPEVNGLFADLLQSAFSEIDWLEVAESLLED